MFWGSGEFFGGMFDFNGDGQTDAAEAAIGFQVLDEMSRENGEDGDGEENDA